MQQAEFGARVARIFFPHILFFFLKVIERRSFRPTLPSFMTFVFFNIVLALLFDPGGTMGRR